MDDLDRAITAINCAPLEGDWTNALRLLAEIGGGWSSQLIGVAANGALLFDEAHNIDRDLLHEFETRGGVDTTRNPRARILTRARPMTVFRDDALADAQELRSDPFYDFFWKVDAPHCGVARIDLDGGARLVAAALRSGKAGAMENENVKQMELLLPHIKRSVELQQRLDGDAAVIASGIIDALGFPVFLLDASGAVKTMTSAAETMLRDGAYLTLRFGALEAMSPACNGRLQRAIKLACGAFPRTGSKILLNGTGDSIVANVAPISDQVSGFGARAVAMLSIPDYARQPASAPDILRTNFGLSRAEAEVAVDLARAVAPAQIAARRGVTLSTVRQQIKTLYVKTDTHSRASLVRLIILLLGSVGS